MSRVTATIRALYVDDDPDFAELTEQRLERETDRVAIETVTDPREVLSKIETDPPDCIVSDYEMPQMDGLELLDRVRKRRPELPYILFTARGSEAVASEAISLGVTDYVQKGAQQSTYGLLANRIENAAEKWRQQRRMAELRSRFEVVLDTMEAAVFLKEPGGRYLLMNNTCRELLGVDPNEDVRELTDQDLFPPDLAEQYRMDDQRVVETDRTIEVEEEVATPNGDQIHLTQKSPVYDQDGNVKAICGVSTDITAQKRRQRTLEQYEEYLDHSPEVMILLNEHGEIEYQSRSGDALHDFDLTQFEDEPPIDDIHPDDRDRVLSDFERVRSSPGEAVTTEFRIQTADGDWVWFEHRAYNYLGEAPIDGILVSAREITERKELERKLEQKNDLLRHTEQLADVGGWETDLEADEHRWTRGTYQITGIDPGEDQELTIEDGLALYHPDDQETIEQAVTRCIEKGETYDEELRLMREDGGVRWVRTAGEPVYEDGEIVKIRGAIQDITDRKEREAELRRQEAMLEYSPDLVLTLDEDGIVEYQSPPSPLFDWEPYQIIGDAPDEHIHPADRAQVGERFTQVLENPDEIIEMEFRARDKDGEWRWIENRAQNFIGEEPIDGVLAVMRDITDRKEYEQELERQTEELETLTNELEEQYQYLFEEAPIMMVRTRVEDGVPVVDDCNRRFVDRLGYERSDVLDCELATFYTEESTRRLLDKGGYGRALKGEFVREDRELVTADGEHVETMLRAVPRQDPKEDTLGTLAMYVDVSERKALEREKTRLEEVTRVLSHDLRNPLNVAKGRAELATEEVESESLEVVLDALDRMEALIEDLLTLARSGEKTQDEQPLALAEVSQHAWQNVETREATLRVEADSRIYAEQSRLKQVFENLFRNAVEHGETDITVRVGELDDENGFFVEDTGPGIPESEQDRIFKAGYSTQQDGTGFGLGIVKQVCKAHEWTIDVCDGSGGGARFEIRDVTFV